MPEPTSLYEKLFEYCPDGVLLTRPDGTILRANPAACDALGRSEEEVCRVGRSELIAPDDPLRELLSRRSTSRWAAGELILRRPDGSTFLAEVTSGLLPAAGDGPLSYVIFRDLTERRRMEEGLRRSNRALRLVTVCNEALVRATSEAELFSAICRLMVEVGGYRMCWAGLAEHDERKTVRPVAHAGHEDGYLATADIVWSDTPRGRGPTGLAIRTGQPAISHDFATDDALKPWLAEAQQRGYRSSTALPLVHQGERFGAITMYSGDVEVFDEPELEILSQLSNDLAYGVYAFRQRDAGAAAEAALRRSEATLRVITDAIADPIFLKDREGRWLFANPATLKVIAKSLDEVLGKSDCEICADPEVGRALAENDQRIMESGRGEVVEETVETPGGLRRYLSTKAPVFDPAGQVTGLVGAALDITDRKRTEDTLREREQLLTMSQRAARIGTWSWKLNEAKVQWTDENYALYGLSPDMGPPDFEFFFQIIHPDDRAVMRAWAQACAAGLRPPPVQFRAFRPDGSLRIVETAGDVIETVDGVPRIVGTAHDVTERERMVEELRQSQARFSTLFSVAPIALALVSADTERFAEVNDAQARLFGCPKESFVGRTATELGLFPNSDDRVRIRELLERDGVARDLAVTGRTMSGELRELVMSVVPTAIDGRPYLLEASVDVTERRRAEAERERLAIAIDQAAEQVVITDRRGSILYVNTAFETVTGYTRAEVLGQNPRILKSGLQDPAFYRELWETIRGGTTWRGRLVNKKKSGEHYTEELTISPMLDASGVVTSYIAVKRDISREIALETQFLQSQKMEGIGRLAGGIAHDFNNMLSVILSYADFALSSLREGDPLREDLLEVDRAGHRAALLTRQLLAFSRKQVLQPESLDLNHTIAEMQKMLVRILGEDIELVQVLASNLGIVRAEPGQVEQVLMNLAVNARDAMPEGGKLTIETANVELDVEYTAQHEGAKPGPHVMLAVSDTGVGMDQSTMARVFEPFFTTKPIGKGTGLGLSTVYGIVKQSGGSIYLYSEPGQGTTFKIYLPREASPERTTKESTGDTRSGGTETILVVEDDAAVRSVARRILAGAGYTVLSAANGGEGLLLCEQYTTEIHLVLTDVVMPLMGGRVFAERLATVRPTIKVLYMSGYTDDAIVQHGVLDAGLRFIGKPLTQRELLRKVREALDG